MECIHSDLVEFTRSSKEKCYLCLSAKLFDPTTSAKTTWSIHKTFVSGKNVLLISILLVNGKYVTNFLEKANIVNDFFSQQYQPISNNSILLLIPFYYTDNRLNDINFKHDKMLKVIQSLYPNKAHGYDCVSVRMLEFHFPSIIKVLLIILCNCLKFGTFPGIWKKCNIVSEHEKGNKQLPIVITLYPSYLYAPKFLKSLFNVIF